MILLVDSEGLDQTAQAQPRLSELSQNSSCSHIYHRKLHLLHMFHLWIAKAKGS